MLLGGTELLTILRRKENKVRADDENRVNKFYAGMEAKFGTKRQASKYLNHYGKVWKQEQNIDLAEPKRRVK